MTKVFVSYSYRDTASEKLFFEVRSLLLALGATPVTGKEVAAGQLLSGQLERLIGGCSLLIAIVLGGAQSDYVQQEIGYAKGKRLKTILITDKGTAGFAAQDVYINIANELTFQGVATLVEPIQHAVQSSKTGPFSNLISRLSSFDECGDDEYIRFSISNLLQIRVDDYYFLVRGDRIKKQFQPVGGVIKVSESVKQTVLKNLGVVDDNKIAIDQDSRNDLRIRIPKASVPAFLAWYESLEGREISPAREFFEEVMTPRIVSQQLFPFLDYEFLKTHVEGIWFSQHFQCKEVLIAHIYKLILDNNQEKEFRRLMSRKSDAYIFAGAERIKQLGIDTAKQDFQTVISRTSAWIL